MSIEKTFAWQYLHYQYFCSRERKVNLLKTLYYKPYKICSKKLLHSEVERTKDIIIKNRYQPDLIKRFIKLHENHLNKP